MASMVDKVPHTMNSKKRERSARCSSIFACDPFRLREQQQNYKVKDLIIFSFEEEEKNNRSSHATKKVTDHESSCSAILKMAKP
ncbi:hypothetical protein TNCV_2688321 [Trichonephila clavipes]|nr:hypothetical protein TNCV_2688321 [Trichonephila clavipes]